MKSFELRGIQCPECLFETLRIEVDALVTFNRKREQTNDSYTVDIFCDNVDVDCGYLNQVSYEDGLIDFDSLEDVEDDYEVTRTPMYNDGEHYEDNMGLQELFNISKKLELM